MSDLILRDKARKSVRRGFFAWVCSWFRADDPSSEAESQSDASDHQVGGQRQSDPDNRDLKVVTLTEDRLEEIVSNALTRQSIELEQKFSQQLQTHVVALNETVTGQVQDLSDRFESQSRRIKSGMEAVLNNLNQFRFQFESKFSSLERHEASVDQSLRFMDESSRRLEELCREQLEDLQDQAQWSREAVESLRQSSRDRVKELRNRHKVEVGALKDFATRQQDDLRKVKRSFAERLRGTSRQLERMADRNDELTEVNKEIHEAEQSQSIWYRFILGPLKKRKQMRQAYHRVDELARHMNQEKEDLHELRRSLHRLAVEVLDYSEQQKMLPVSLPASPIPEILNIRETRSDPRTDLKPEVDEKDITRTPRFDINSKVLKVKS